MTLSCPVCKRDVTATNAGRVRRHNDTAHNSCPMSGHMYPVGHDEPSEE